MTEGLFVECAFFLHVQFRSTHSLSRLSFDILGERLGDGGAVALAEALKTNTDLMEVE
jgi:hypothetical protein